MSVNHCSSSKTPSTTKTGQGRLEAIVRQLWEGCPDLDLGEFSPHPVSYRDGEGQPFKPCIQRPDELHGNPHHFQVSTAETRTTEFLISQPTPQFWPQGTQEAASACAIARCFVQIQSGTASGICSATGKPSQCLSTVTLHPVPPVPAGARGLATAEHPVFPRSVARPPLMLLPR